MCKISKGSDCTQISLAVTAGKGQDLLHYMGGKV